MGNLELFGIVTAGVVVANMVSDVITAVYVTYMSKRAYAANAARLAQLQSEMTDQLHHPTPGTDPDRGYS